MNRLVVCVLALSPLGCIKPPEIVMVDRATALEQQAGGSFEDVEKKLVRSAIAPRPVPLTPDQLKALGIKPAPLVDTADMTEADRIDALLRQHCVGEGRDGLLVDTYDDCVGATDRAVAVELVDRTNRAREQLWRWMHAQRADTSVEVLRRTWRETHARGVVCGAWMQGEDRKWEAKKC